MNTPIKGKVAIVTGAGSGIGRAIAKKLANMGANVIASDINFEAAKETFSKLEKIFTDQNHGAEVIDVTNFKETQKTFDLIYKKYGNINILINNAGVSTMGHFWDLSEEEWEFNIDVNLKGVFICTKLILPYMKNKGGKIVNIASMAALKGARFLTHYAASKSGVVGLTQNSAVEYAEFGITINCVCPGYVKTSMQEKEIKWEAELRGMTPKEIQDEYINTTPLGRLCMPEDVANGVGFLVSPEADFITGAVLDISGGVAIT